MRKYSIPKCLYIFVSAILLCFSFGYTYAYFSAQDVVSGNAAIYSVDVSWINLSTSSEIAGSNLYPNNSDTITLANNLVRGAYTHMQSPTYDNNGAVVKDNNGNVKLQNVNAAIQNNSQIPIYCRVKLVASYVDASSQTVDITQYVKLGYYSEEAGEPEFITTNSWVYDNTTGYYYYAPTGNISNLAEQDAIQPSNGCAVAEYIYLDPSSSTVLYGKDINMTLSVEAVQASNNAYKSVWGIS